MGTLHIVNKPATRGGFARCLAVASANDHVLFIEDGVYCALPAVLAGARREDLLLHALGTDVHARGIDVLVSPQVEVIDERRFVDLVVACRPIVTWS